LVDSGAAGFANSFLTPGVRQVQLVARTVVGPSSIQHSTQHNSGCWQHYLRRYHERKKKVFTRGKIFPNTTFSRTKLLV
jgi:hypothetical protein